MLFEIKFYWESNYAADRVWFDWEREDWSGYTRYKGCRWYLHYDEEGYQDYKVG